MISKIFHSQTLFQRSGWTKKKDKKNNSVIYESMTRKKNFSIDHVKGPYIYFMYLLAFFLFLKESNQENKSQENKQQQRRQQTTKLGHPKRERERKRE